jgi:osmotically-inducible protein OsmY
MPPTDDVALRLEVLRQIERDQIGDWDEVRVLVHHGEVTLAGCVETEAEKHLAEAAARCVPHVRQVINRIEAPDAAQRRRDARLMRHVQQVLSSLPLPIGAIRVRVVNGIVKLTGWVRVESDRRWAESEILCLNDVLDVRSRIAVRQPESGQARDLNQTLMGKALGG